MTKPLAPISSTPTSYWTDPERRVAAACVVLGIVVAIAASISERNPIVGAVYYLPQAMALGVLMPFSFRPSVVSGAAVVLAAHLALFHSWVFSSSSPDPLTWLGYLFALPGAAIGAVLGALLLHRRPLHSSFQVGAISGLFTLGGLLTNQFLMCTSVMYCGW